MPFIFLQLGGFKSFKSSRSKGGIAVRLGGAGLSLHVGKKRELRIAVNRREAQLFSEGGKKGGYEGA